MSAVWLAIKAWFGGLPSWVVPAVAGAVAVIAVVYGIYHAGEASARADQAEQRANENAQIIKQEREARARSEAAFAEANAKAIKLQADTDLLKEEISRVAKGNASPGCARAIRGVLSHSGAPSGPIVPGKPSPNKHP